MQSLATFAEFTYGTSLNMNIDVSVDTDDDFQHSFNVNPKNNLVLQQLEVPLWLSHNHLKSIIEEYGKLF
jgi:hypothetical protein